MGWKTDLRSRLLADPPLSGLLAERIAWIERGRSWGRALPALTLQTVLAGREYTHSGTDGLDRPRVQFDIYAADFDSLEAVKAALIAELEQAGVEQGGTRFGFATLEFELGHDPTDLGDGTSEFRLQLDFEFTWCAIP